jgi:bifunctional non-homologous end joining protein LigD
VEILLKKKGKIKAGNDFKLTHPKKIMYPEDKYTKEDIADYYEQIHELILPYITNRPLTLVRCPDGIDSCFFQKHLNEAKAPGLHEIMIKEKNKSEKGIYIDDLEGLMALPQMGVLEIHTWGSLIDDIEHPDMIVFDLDPAPDLPWKNVVAAAFEIKKYMTDLKLKSFVKTTGGKGLHVVLPIQPEFNWKQVKAFAKTFVDFITGEHPDKYINKMTKSKRTNKIFLDYHRNGRGATAVAPYSTRARPHAPVAVPLFWDELTNNYKDTFYTIKTLPDRRKKDPWKDFFKIKQSLNLKR